MRSTNKKKFHFRHQSFTSKNQHYRAHAVQHHQYLEQLQKNHSVYPRYDVFSENNHNNLILHIKHDMKEELKPKKTSFLMSKLQQKILNYQQFRINSRNFSRANSKNITMRSIETNNQKDTQNDIYSSSRIEDQNRQKKYEKEQENSLQKRSVFSYSQQQDQALLMQNKLKKLYLGPGKFNIKKAKK